MEEIQQYDTMHIPDPDSALEMLDQRLNAVGEIPQVCGYDSNGSPVLLWLNEEGGDSVYLVAADLLGSEAAEFSSVNADVDPAKMNWPIKAFFPARPRAHMEVQEL